MAIQRCGTLRAVKTVNERWRLKIQNRVKIVTVTVRGGRRIDASDFDNTSCRCSCLLQLLLRRLIQLLCHHHWPPLSSFSMTLVLLQLFYTSQNPGSKSDYIWSASRSSALWTWVNLFVINCHLPFIERPINAPAWSYCSETPAFLPRLGLYFSL